MNVTTADERHNLLDESTLAESSIVANSLMNRERVCVGKNSYQQELLFNPLDWLAERLARYGKAAWLDLCCGRGGALQEASQAFRHEPRLKLIGVDLIPFFDGKPPSSVQLEFVAASLAEWNPTQLFDLITCVHGLHYIGDKLGLLQRAASWLTPDGRLLAHLDPDNIRFADTSVAGRVVLRQLKEKGVTWNARKHLLSCDGQRSFQLPFQYLGANDTAGPNYTGQASVHSFYHPL